MAKRITDWEMAERDYRVGVLSVQLIAEKYGVNKATIHRRAKQHNWTRDLSQQVQIATKAKMNAMVVADATELQLERNYLDVFEVESQANINAGIIRSHQTVSGNQKAIMNSLMTELKEQVAEGRKTIAELTKAVLENYPDAYKDLYRVLTLPSRVDTLKKLTELHNNIITAERKAYNIDAEEKKGFTTIEDLIKRAEAQDDFDRY